MSMRATIQRWPASPALAVEIPAALIQALGLQPGDTLAWSVNRQGQMVLGRREGACDGAPPAGGKKGAGHC
jgi:antitoxin component of MazEF toxin-antitoxin module